MDKINYSKCPLKKRPIYIINEEIEDEIEEGPIDLSVQKWHNKLKNNTQIYKEPIITTPQFAINYSTKLQTIKEENYLNNNYEYEKLQNITPTSTYSESDDYQLKRMPIEMRNNENDQQNLKQYEYNTENYHHFNEDQNLNNNFIKNNYEYNNNLPIKSYQSNKLQYLTDNYQAEDLSKFHNNENILSENLINIKTDNKYIRKEFRDKTNNDLYYKCNICNKCYSTNSGLIKHQQYHTNRQQSIQNNKIDNNLEINGIANGENILNTNILNNNSQKLINIQRYQCKDCQKSYSTFSGLTKHQQFHCPNSEQNQVKKIFSCKNCDKVYVSLGALKMHIRTHTLPCKCPLCGKAFSRPWLLQGHIRTHTGEKPFSCQHCNRAFADRSNLRAHLQTHSDVKKYSCTSCTKTFSRMSLLAKHLQGNGCQTDGIINDECHQNGSVSSTDYHNTSSIDEDSFYETTKSNQSVIVQNNFYGNLENSQQQQFHDYANENFVGTSTY